jgi:hypothetical protein
LGVRWRAVDSRQRKKHAPCPAKAIFIKEITYEIKRANTSGWSHGLHFAVAFGDTDSRVIYYLLTSRLFLTNYGFDLTELLTGSLFLFTVPELLS